MCARLFPEPEYFLCVKTDANCPKLIPGKLLNPKQIILKKNLNDLRERGKKKKERKETLRRKSSISRHPCGASHGELRPVNVQQDNSQRLSSKITAMAVCLTSTVTSSLLLLLFFPPLSYLFPCDQGRETQYPRCALFSPGRHGNPKTRGGREWNSCVSSITGRQRRDCCALWVTRGECAGWGWGWGPCAVWTGRPWAETWMFTLFSWRWHWFRFSSERRRKRQRETEGREGGHFPVYAGYKEQKIWHGRNDINQSHRQLTDILKLYIWNVFTFLYVQSSMSCCDNSVLTVWLGLGVWNENVLAYLGLFSTNKARKCPKVLLEIPSDQWKLFQQLIKNSWTCCHSQQENVPTSRQKYHILLPLIQLGKVPMCC